jgi:hypothetical protein
MPAKAPPPLPCAPVWREFGRPSSGEAQDWTTWVSLLGDGGDALYRSLVVGDGAISVTVDLHSRRRSGTRTIHRGRCGLPPDPEQTAERVGLLLTVADKAVARAPGADRGGGEGAATGRASLSSERASPSSRRVPAAALAGRRDGVSAARHETEDRTRERARPEAATAA